MCATMNNRISRTVLAKAAGVVLAGAAGIFGMSNSASAHDRVIVETRPVAQRVWVEPVYEDRPVQVLVPATVRTVCDRVWVPAQYSTVTDRVWVAPQFRDVVERVWCPPVGRTVVERAWLAPGGGPQREFAREVRPGHYEDVVRREQVCAGHYEDVTRQVLVADAHWQNVERQEVVVPAHYETRMQRVCVREGRWDERFGRRNELDIRLPGIAARIPLGL